MKVVYVCSPFSQGIMTENLKKAREYSRQEVEMGNIPIAPHLLFPQFMEEDGERDIAMKMNKEILWRCDELHVYGKIISAGMKKEISWAKELGKKVIYC